MPKTGSIVFGVLLVGVALWALLSWLPAHKPWTDGDLLRLAGDAVFGLQVERLNEWRLKPGPYYWGPGFAILFGLWGLSRIVYGASYRPRIRAR